MAKKLIEILKIDNILTRVNSVYTTKPGDNILIEDGITYIVTPKNEYDDGVPEELNEALPWWNFCSDDKKELMTLKYYNKDNFEDVKHRHIQHMFNQEYKR